MSALGKIRRLFRLFDANTKRTVMVPLDDSLLAGPEGGLRRLPEKLSDVLEGRVNAVLGFKGLFQNNSEQVCAVGCILNLTASSIRSVHTRKTQVSTVEEAISLGVDAVAVHVNVSSQYETEMLRILGGVSRECEKFGMPLMALMYVRSERNGRDYNYDDVLRDNPETYAQMVRHAARVGVELGADIVKTQFTGTADSFATVVESCGKIPIVIAGGPMVEVPRMLDNAHQAIQAGAAGVCFGRNVFNRKKSSEYVKALRGIIHEEWSVEEAMQSISE